MGNSPFPCSRCGSKNTQLRSSLPGDLLTEMKETLLSLGRDPLREGGQKFVVCKDCGHVSMVCIR